MKLVLDEAIILNKKESSNSNLIIDIFCENLGKISALGYNIRNSKKTDLNSLIPGKVSELELEEKNSSYILKNTSTKYLLKENLKSIYKLQLSLYVLHCLNILLPYGYQDKNLYKINVDILKYINDVDEEKLKNEQYFYFFILKYLKMLMVEFGIYDKEEILNSSSLKSIYYKNKEEIKVHEIKKLILRFESYINNYYLSNINYRKIII